MFIVIGVVGIVFILLFIIINITQKKSRSQVEILADLEKAKAELESASAKLGDLDSQFHSSGPSAIINIQGSYTLSENVMSQTENISIKNDLDLERPKINQMLKVWKDHVAVLSVETINQNTISEAKNNLTTIKVYLEELKNIVANLTPANSGLTQQEIDSYKILVAGKVIEVSSAVSEMSNTKLPDSTKAIVTITQEDVQAQNIVVSKAEDKVATLEQELIGVQDDNQQTPTQTPTPEPDNSLPPVGDPFHGNANSDKFIPEKPVLIQGW